MGQPFDGQAFDVYDVGRRIDAPGGVRFSEISDGPAVGAPEQPPQLEQFWPSRWTTNNRKQRSTRYPVASNTKLKAVMSCQENSIVTKL